MGDSVLERNLCFVDTPGYSHNKSPTESIDLVIRYLTDQIKKTHSFANIGNGDLIGLLSGNGGTQVDVVFYLIANGNFSYFQGFGLFNQCLLWV